MSSTHKFPKIIFICCTLHNFCQLMDEAHPGGRPKCKFWSPCGLNKQRHLCREGCGQERRWEVRYSWIFFKLKSGYIMIHVLFLKDIHFFICNVKFYVFELLFSRKFNFFEYEITCIIYNILHVQICALLPYIHAD